MVNYYKIKFLSGLGLRAQLKEIYILPCPGSFFILLNRNSKAMRSGLEKKTFDQIFDREREKRKALGYNGGVCHL